ncbi:hypothetical protein FQZ97_980050 [compost metagenome]
MPAALASQAAYTSFGIANGAWGQPRASRVSLISSAPSGSPWALAVLARFGLPLPMVVLQQIRVGLSALFLAAPMALSTASASWPSTARITFQPQASKRLGVSSMNQGATWPSMEMPLSSYRATSLLSFQAPASAMASWLMPSIRQPSPRKT